MVSDQIAAIFHLKTQKRSINITADSSVKQTPIENDDDDARDDEVIDRRGLVSLALVY